jgi:hypothetical protein
MKRIYKTTPLFVCCLLFVLNSFSQEYITKYFPRYQKVIRNFYTDYDVQADYPDGVPKFEKRKEGWFITVYDNTGIKPVKTALYWSAKEGHYTDPGLTHKKFPDVYAEIPADVKDEWLAASFNNSPYLGYVGWEKDLIREFEGRKDLNDSLYNSLARAYSSRASNFLEDQSTFGDKRERFIRSGRRNALSPQQLEKYRECEHKAIECFEKVNALNPLFETPIGDISTKCGNEYMSAFLALLTEQNEKEARKEIPEKRIYSDFIIGYAKNILNTCAQDAILFTNGDNDTFPLLYVQAKLGFRTDVRVVNISLINLPRCIDLLKDTIFSSIPLPVSLDSSDYAPGVRDYLLLKNTGEAMNVYQAFKMLKDTSCVHKAEKLYYFPSGKLKIKVPATGGEAVFSFSGSYIYKSDLIILDLLTHKGSRPMYFSNTVGAESYAPYSRFLSNEGLAIRVVIQDKPYNPDIPVDSKNLYEDLMKKFEWKGLDVPPTTTRGIFGRNYRIIFTQLIRQLISNGETDSARAAMTKCLSLFPDQVIPYDDVMISFVEFSLELKDETTSLEIARKMLPRLKESPIHNQYMAYLNNLAKTKQSKKLEDLLSQYPDK